MLARSISWYKHTTGLSTPSQGYDTEFHPSGSLLLVTHDNGSMSMFDPRGPHRIGKYECVVLVFVFRELCFSNLGKKEEHANR